jgi:hypothetical protein
MPRPPTPEEIARLCKRIQAGWSEEVEWCRRHDLNPSWLPDGDELDDGHVTAPVYRLRREGERIVFEVVD